MTAPGREKKQFPLLGIIVDRSSFDDDDKSMTAARPKDKNDPFSLDDNDGVNGYDDSEPPSKPFKIKDGKVRRKLRWKPAAFRSKKNKKKDDASVVTQKSNKSQKSFHTFSSTETPVQSNQSKRVRLPISRPNYRDTFGADSLATIDSGLGSFKSGSRDTRPRYQQSVLGANRSSGIRGRPAEWSNHHRSFDFESIQENSSNMSEYSTTGQGDDMTERRSPTHTPFDPYGEGSAPRKTRLRSRSIHNGTSTRSPPPPSNAMDMVNFPSPGESPVSAKNGMTFYSPKSKASPGVSMPGTPKTVNSTMDTTVDATFMTEASFDTPSLEESDVERRTSFFGEQYRYQRQSPPLGQTNQPATSTRGTNTFANPSQPLSSGIVSAKQRTTPTKHVGGMGRPPRNDKPSVTMNSSLSPIRRLSPESVPVPAKVPGINLDSPKNLTSMMKKSGLLLGQHYDQDTSKVSPTKSYNRPTDNTFTSFEEGSGPASVVPISDQDSLSTRSSNIGKSSTGKLVIQPKTLVDSTVRRNSNSKECGKSAGAVKTLGSRRNRADTGPVDVDDGAFVDAERHLKAIHQMAEEHLEHGEYEEALYVFEEILRGQQERYGENHYRVGTALHNIGIVHLKSGNHEEAVKICSDAVRVRKDALLPNHPDVAVSLAQLGVAHLESRQYREALIAFREALQIRRDLLGPKHPKVGKILNNIGCALYELEELDGAKLAFEEALDIQRETLRSSPTISEADDANGNTVLLSVGSTLCNIGSIKLRWGHYEEAGVALEEALLIQQSVLGDEHPTVLSTIQSIDFVDKAMDEGITEPPTAQDFANFAQERGWEDASEFSKTAATAPAGCPGAEATTVKRVLDMLRWNRSKRWYFKLNDYLVRQCGGSDDESEPAATRLRSNVEKPSNSPTSAEF